tara:strand:- start:1231 stop:1569 length:339 start_codon:yes stop_codon:yes gene_type:complete
MNWQTLTKRTNDPKLSYVERELNRRGIPHRRKGESFHAPILEVPDHFFELAWDKIICPIDNVPDHHAVFIHENHMPFDAVEIINDHYAEELADIADDDGGGDPWNLDTPWHP